MTVQFSPSGAIFNLVSFKNDVSDKLLPNAIEVLTDLSRLFDLDATQHVTTITVLELLERFLFLQMSSFDAVVLHSEICAEFCAALFEILYEVSHAEIVPVDRAA